MTGAVLENIDKVVLGNIGKSRSERVNGFDASVLRTITKPKEEVRTLVGETSLTDHFNGVKNWINEHGEQTLYGSSLIYLGLGFCSASFIGGYDGYLGGVACGAGFALSYISSTFFREKETLK